MNTRKASAYLPPKPSQGIAMNQVLNKKTGDLAIAGSNRIDKRQRDIVDDAIRMQQRGNTVAALEFLRGRDVDHRVIQRVLLEPKRRRALGLG